MNPHHLELFYFVAKHEGITEAVRKMPYGIQQPAVSGQILQLEKNLGVQLFRRRPFALTQAGQELYQFIEPFFSRLDIVAQQLSGEESQHLRLAASSSALTYHLPEVLHNLRVEYPELRLTLKDLTPAETESALEKQEVDVVFSVLHRKTANSIKSVQLIDIPIVLLSPQSLPYKSFDDLVEGAVGGHIQSPLISLPKHETVSQVFQKGLDSHNIVWETSMEVSEISLIENYVSRDFGIGISADIPGKQWNQAVRKISLPDGFPPLSMGILYTGKLKPIAERFVELTQGYAAQLKNA